MKDKVTIPGPSHREKAVFSGPVWILEMVHYPLGCVTPAHIPGMRRKLLALGGPTTRKGSSAGLAALPFGPCGPADPMVLEVLVVDRDSV